MMYYFIAMHKEKITQILIAPITLFLINDHSLSSPVLVAIFYPLKYLQQMDVVIIGLKLIFVFMLPLTASLQMPRLPGFRKLS